MQVSTLSLGQMQTNCYFLEDRGNCVIIDPADSADFLLEKIQREGLHLEGLIATHGHFDHVMAVGEIQLSFDVPLYIDRADEFLIKRVNKTAEHFLGFNPGIVEPIKFQWFPQTDQELHIGSFNFRLLHCPGHTPGSVALYFPEEMALYTGDTLFNGAIGRTDLSYSNKQDLLKSLNKLFQLPEETFVYPGHGEDTSIGVEKLTLS